MYLVEYEFSSDEEENVCNTALLDTEKKKEKEKEKKEETEKEQYQEKREEKEEEKEKENENRCNNNTHVQWKQNIHEIKNKTKQIINKEELDGKEEKNEKYKRRKLEENAIPSKRNDVKSNESSHNFKNNEQINKTEKNLYKSDRVSRWDNEFFTGKSEKKKEDETVKNYNIVTKGNILSTEVKGVIDKNMANRKREKREEGEEEQPKKEEEKLGGNNFFENNILMNINVNENNFENIFEQEPNEYSPYINKKIDELKKLYDMGLTINKHISESNEYKNPCILEKIMDIFEIEQHASNYPVYIFDPTDLDTIDLFNEHEKKKEETIHRSSKWSSQN